MTSKTSTRRFLLGVTAKRAPTLNAVLEVIRDVFSPEGPHRSIGHAALMGLVREELPDVADATVKSLIAKLVTAGMLGKRGRYLRHPGPKRHYSPIANTGDTWFYRDMRRYWLADWPAPTSANV